MTTTIRIPALTYGDMEARLELIASAIDAAPPAEPGIYLKLLRVRGAEPREWPVLYIGRGDGEHGLRGRNQMHVRERLVVNTHTTLEGKRTHARGVLAGIAELDLVTVWFVTGSIAATATDIERQMLAYSMLITGATPLLNGLGFDFSPSNEADVTREMEAAGRLGIKPLSAVL